LYGNTKKQARRKKKNKRGSISPQQRGEKKRRGPPDGKPSTRGFMTSWERIEGLEGHEVGKKEKEKINKISKKIGAG